MSNYSLQSTQSELLRRLSDLATRCEKNMSVANSSFLTPAESLDAEKLPLPDGVSLLLHGGFSESERKIAFFLPYYLDEGSFDAGEVIKAVRIQSYFGEPGHRDYLGAILGLGIERNRIGDILVDGSSAVLFCMASVSSLIIQELDKVGRYGVKTELLPLSEIPVPERKTKLKSFTVKSLRLDAVTGDMFGFSRTSAAEYVRLGAVTLNYNICDKTDASVKEGDIISVRGKGKGKITAVGGRSKKDRLFIEAEIYIS